MRRPCLRATSTFKQRLGLLLDYFLPLAYLHRLDVVLLANLIYRLDSSQRLQAYLRLEHRPVNLAFLRFTHDFPISCDSVLLKPLS